MGNSDFEPIFCFVNSDNFFFIAIGLFFAFCFLGAGLYLYFLERRKRALRKAYEPICFYCGSDQMVFGTRSKPTPEIVVPGRALSELERLIGPEGLPKVAQFYRCRNCGKESTAGFYVGKNYI